MTSLMGKRQQGTAVSERIPVVNARILGLLVAIVLAMVIFSLLNPNFLTTRNMLGLVRAMSSLALVSLGLTLVIVAGEIDLSFGSTYGLTAMLSGIIWIAGVPLYAALLIGLLTAVLIGVINATLTTLVGIPSFIVTLGMMNFVYGTSLFISGARGINPVHQQPPLDAGEIVFFRTLGATRLPVLDVPIQILWLVVLAVIVGLLLHRSLVGFRIYAIGGNPEAAKIARIAVRRHKYLVFMLCGLLAGIAGILDFSFLGSTDPSSGQALLFPAFAAVIMGGASLSGGRGTILGTILGASLLAILTNGLSLIGVGAFAQLMFVGAALIAAVSLDRWTTRTGRQQH